MTGIGINVHELLRTNQECRTAYIRHNSLLRPNMYSFAF